MKKKSSWKKETGKSEGPKLEKMDKTQLTKVFGGDAGTPVPPLTNAISLNSSRSN